jgi:hypothetical protein
MKQSTHLDKFNNLGGRPVTLFKIGFSVHGDLHWVKYYEDRELFDSVVAHYTGPGGYGRARLVGLRMDFLQAVAVGDSGGTLEWQATRPALEHLPPEESAS